MSAQGYYAQMKIGTIFVGRYNQFGSAYADEEHQRVLKANNVSKINFYFGQSMNPGNLHISFDAKALSPSQHDLCQYGIISEIG